MNNLVWRDIYDSLLKCWKNVVSIQPLEFLSVPIMGEPFITKNNTPVNQLWCRNLMIKDVLNNWGDWKQSNGYTDGQKPVFFFELSALNNAIGEYISQSQYICGRTHMESIRDIKPSISNYNIYGRIVNKKA